MSCAERSKVASQHFNLSRKLNLSQQIETMSWNNYVTISSNFTLEGDYNHWICCSLYAASRKVHVSNGSGNSAAEGNFMSLTTLLFLCNISINEFFKKIKKWLKMVESPLYFFTDVQCYERIFEISFGLYLKYNSIFDQLFIVRPMINHTEGSPMECTVQNLYEFCWCLFLCIKKADSGSSTDTVVSLNLLLCVFDYVYANATTQYRCDILNTSFNGLPKNWCTTDDSDSDDSPAPQTPFSIFEKLCEMFSLDTTFAKYVKKHYFTEIIQKFFRNKILFGNCRDFLKIISTEYFASNVRALNNYYDHQILATGEFDERILLGFSCFREDDEAADESDEQLQRRDIVRILLPGTLVNEQRLLPWQNISLLVTIAMRNAKNVNLLVQRICLKISTRKIMNEDMIVQLEKLLDEMCAVFCQKYPIKSEAKEKFDLSKVLCFCMLAKILLMDQTTKTNLKWMFEEEIALRTLITFFLVIILMSTGSELEFPWILECFDVQAFFFVKMTEIFMSYDDGFLSRSVLIHLKIIEEKCLHSLVWCSNSMLWEVIAHWDGPIPSRMDVDSDRISQTVAESADAKKPDETVLETNENSADARFTPNSGESAKRELIAPSGTNSATSTSTGGASTLSSPSKGENAVAKPTETSSEPDERKLTNPLLIFCKNFYELAFGRILELCCQLGLSNDKNIQEIWTLFEYTIVNKTELMRDRHLDQIIMCAIYVFIKGNHIPNILLTDITEYYMNQPHARRNVYSEVLIQPAVKDSDGNEICPPIHNDIVQFFDCVYSDMMDTFYN